MNSSKLIDFGKLLKISWQYVWRYKFLWFLGILIGGGVSTSGNNFSYLFNSNSEKQNWQNYFDSNKLDSISGAGKVLGQSNYLSSTSVIIFIALIVLVLAVVMIYLQVTARGAIISAVDKIDQNKHVSLSQSWRTGHKYFWKIFFYSVLVCLIIFVPLSFLSAPIILMATIRWYIPAIIIGMIFLLIIIVYIIYISLIAQYGERILVIENRGPWESIKAGLVFFNKNWKNVLLFYLIIVAVMLASGAALMFASLMVVGILAAIIYGIYTLSSTVAIIVSIPIVLALLILMLVISGIISSYQSTFITLAYKEIIKNN